MDQLIGDDSAGDAPRSVAFDFHPAATRLRSVDVIHVTDGSIITGGPRTNERERARRAKQFVRRLRRNRVALVRTVLPHEVDNQTSRADSILNDAAKAVITLFDAPGLATGGNTVKVIPHSHLKARFLGYPQGEMTRGRALLATTRTFTEVDEAVLKLFSIVDSPRWTLSIIGKIPTTASDSYARTLADHAARISVRDDALSDAAHAMEISRSEIVIITAPDTYEGLSKILLALSLDRPVLVQDTPMTRALAEEVGGSWVRRHQGPLTAHALEAALQNLQADPPAHQPSLELRDPNEISERYAAVFRAAAASRE